MPTLTGPTKTAATVAPKTDEPRQVSLEYELLVTAVNDLENVFELLNKELGPILYSDVPLTEAPQPPEPCIAPLADLLRNQRCRIVSVVNFIQHTRRALQL